MEFTPGGLTAAGASPVIPQLADHELAHGVVEVRRIVGTAQRLLPGAPRIGVRLLAEQPLGFGELHAMRMHADGGDEAHVAQQRIHELADVRLRVAVAQALLPHQLLAIVGPAFGKGVAHEHAIDHRAVAVRMQELQKVPWPHFVHGREQEIRAAGQVGVLHFGRPRGIRRRDIKHRGSSLLVRPRNVDIGEVIPIVGGRFLDQSLLVPGNRDEPLFLDEASKVGELLARGLHGTACGLIVGGLVDAGAHRFSRQVGRTGGAQRRRIARKIRGSDFLKLSERRRHAFGCGKHLRELLLAEGEVVGRILAVGDIPGAQITHRCFGGAVGFLELRLQRCIRDARESLGNILMVEIGESLARRQAAFQQRPRKWQPQVGLHLADGRHDRTFIVYEGTHASF